MAAGLRLKTSKPRLSFQRNKHNGGEDTPTKPFTKRKNNTSYRKTKYDSDDNNSYTHHSRNYRPNSEPSEKKKGFNKDGKPFYRQDADSNRSRDYSDDEMRGRGKGRRDVGKEGKFMSRKGGRNNVGYSEKKTFSRKRRVVDGDYFEEEEISSGMREMRGSQDVRKGRGGNDRKQRDFNEDYSEENVRSSRPTREMRGQRDRKPSRSEGDSMRLGGERRMDRSRNEERNGHRGNKDDSRGGREFLTSEDKGMPKWKNKEKYIGNEKEKVKNEEKTIEVEEKPIRLQTRVLDKSGKKIRTRRKASEEDADRKEAPPKKKKRVIKLDPCDTSNKRLDDSIPEPNNEIASSTEKDVDKDAEISKNAQFRAIQPSPAILSFVEDNLLGRRRLNELKNAGYNLNFSAPLDNIPFSTRTIREHIEENVFKSKLDFFAAAKISSSFPPPLLPEIAFAGRSNVGKSSLLNALTRQWGVVRTSDKPGLTQSINFFRLASELSLVDLPGYGFAYAKEEVKDAWEELVKEYVSTRVGLQRVCLLIDTKWGMKPRDHELIDLMERSQTPYQIVLTKTDVVFPIDVARRAMQIQENLKKNKSIVKPVVMVSSKSGAGIRNLRTVLAKIGRFVKP